MIFLCSTCNHWAGSITSYAAPCTLNCYPGKTTAVTLAEFLLAVLLVADVVLHCVTLLAVRDTLHTFVAHTSKRREWTRQEHEG